MGSSFVVRKHRIPRENCNANFREDGQANEESLTHNLSAGKVLRMQNVTSEAAWRYFFSRWRSIRYRPYQYYIDTSLKIEERKIKIVQPTGPPSVENHEK
ncbi:hypothetical protein I7I51_03996 [Histoplasma capsulatum]|uniref:Uncharacterized protein n=1 Tax=Ajellomyces capsulatus TaxID=5037 RepID=A0A8A1M726_AJECA|nr:hypothetical protein I7I51_03996 [Histoplasma capsulatum]